MNEWMNDKIIFLPEPKLKRNGHNEYITQGWARPVYSFPSLLCGMIYSVLEVMVCGLNGPGVYFDFLLLPVEKYFMVL